MIREVIHTAGRRYLIALAAGSVVAAALTLPAVAISSTGNTTIAFRTEPVVLTGAAFPDWSAGPEVTARPPQLPTDYAVYDTQGQTPGLARSACYQAHPRPDVNGYTDPNHGDHNCFQPSLLPVRTVPGRAGVPAQSLRGYRWNGRAFVQIPFQVDTKWQHYLTNNASGFAFYSGVDRETTYTFDREGFRDTTNAPFTAGDPAVVCAAKPTSGPTPDPNPGLIDTDELAFMARDAGLAAPASARLPKGIAGAREVRLTDPATGAARFVYVMQSAPAAGGTWAVPPAFTAANSPYVRYQRDPNADEFVASSSSYGDYGNAPKGPVCTAAGQPVIGQGFRRLPSGALALDPATFVQRRPLDTATVTTPRYRFRYDGRWLMDSLQVSPDDAGLTRADYGPSIIDRYKGRAFQQSPGGNTPCCGYEDEQNNWGGSSVVMGERVGPVRDIRVTWGSDSGTNVVRTEVFYAEQVDHVSELRVHPIPPLDGIYSQWDMAAGRVTTYYNPYNPGGVPIAGINPVRVGDISAHAGPDGVSYTSNDQLGRLLGPLSIGRPNNATCGSKTCVYGSFNLPDPTFSGVASEVLSWDEMAGPAGTMVEKYTSGQLSPAGEPLGLVEAVPYYVDDACFDDGTGRDPGPHLAKRSPNEPTTWGYDRAGVPVSPAPAGSAAHARRCWNHHPDGTPYNIRGTASFDSRKPVERSDPPPDPSFSPQGDIRYYQGDVATHGLHLLFNVESDNANLPVPVDELSVVDQQIVLSGNPGNVGSVYNRQLVAPLVPVVSARA